MRLKRTHICVTLFAIAALSACSSGARGVLPAPIAPQAGNAPDSLTTCPSAKAQPAWIFKGACQTGTIAGKGISIALAAYKGFTVTGSVAKTSLKKAAPFVVVDATGNRDVGKDGGKAFPKYTASGSKTLLYLQFVNGGTSAIRIKGKPAIQLAITDARATSAGDCAIALLQETGSKFTWNALAIPVKAKGSTYSIAIPSLPVALSPGAAYLALACSSTAPSPSPSPSSSPSYAQYAVPAGSEPYGVAAGPDGNVWFTEVHAGNVAKITPSGTITEYAVPNSCYSVIGPYPQGITSGPNGDVWVAAPACGVVDSISTSGTLQHSYSEPATGYCSLPEPTWMATGPDANVWFTDPHCEVVGSINVTSGVVTTYGPVSGGNLGPIASGPDGNLWFTVNEYNDAPYVGAIGRITTSGTMTFFPLPAVPGESAYPTPSGITGGPDGNVWFTFSYSAGNAGVGSISPSGTIAEHEVGGSWAGTIVKGSDGKLWYAYGGGSSMAQTDNGVGSVTTLGSFTTYPLSLQGHVLGGIAQGADGRFWVTDYTGGSIYALGFSGGASLRR
jgi:virginiamycin B lyase